ncbi:hypothetical protein D3C84_700800 [compost metagenome]
MFGKAQARRARVNTTVDVGLSDIHQLVGALQFGHAQDNLHGHLRGFAMLAVEQRTVEPGELNRLVGFACVHQCFGWLPAIDGHVIEHRQRGAFDSGEGFAAQGSEGLPADAQHRQGALENGLCHQHAQGQDLIGFGQDQSGRCMTVADQLHQHAAAGTRPATTGNGQHTTVQMFAAERMVTVDDFTRARGDAAPEAKPDIGKQQRALGGARDQVTTNESSGPRHAGHLSSRPLARSGRSAGFQCRPIW